MAVRRPFFRSQGLAWATGLALVGAGAWCFHDAFNRRGQQPPWLVKFLTPGM